MPYLKKTKKYTNHVTRPLIFADISIYSSEISKFFYIRKYRYRLQFGITSFKSLEIFLKNMVTILMMSAKLATSGLLKRKIFQNKDYDVIVPDYGFTNKILSRDSNYIVNVVMWPKFGNSSICMRKVTITSILQGSDQKKHFFWGVVLVLALDIILKFCTSVAKGLKLKVRRFWEVKSYVCRSCRGKTVRGTSSPTPLPSSWIGLKETEW